MLAVEAGVWLCAIAAVVAGLMLGSWILIGISACFTAVGLVMGRRHRN